jgi:phage repressor protein C with HTH and peptisase S24 domain
MFKILKVRGHSLQPDVRPGDFVVVACTPLLRRSLRPGDLVVFQRKPYGVMIKRVHRVDNDQGVLFVLGTDEDSLDSRSFGALRYRDLIGKVIWHVRGGV